MEAYLDFDFFECLCEKMGCHHPRLEGAERMFDGPPTDRHGVEHVVKLYLHRVEHGFAIPTTDPPQLLQRAAGFERACEAGGQVAIEIDITVTV